MATEDFNTDAPKQENAFALLDDIEKRMNTTMEMFSSQDIETITKTAVYGDYEDYNTSKNIESVANEVGGYDKLLDRNSESRRTLLGERFDEVVINDNFSLFKYVESLKENPEFQKYIEGQKGKGIDVAEGKALTGAVVGFTLLKEKEYQQEKDARAESKISDNTDVIKSLTSEGDKKVSREVMPENKKSSKISSEKLTMLRGIGAGKKVANSAPSNQVNNIKGQNPYIMHNKIINRFNK